METHELLAFGTFRLDMRARLLSSDGVPIPLPPKSYEMLVYLVKNRGRAVPREELVREIWPDVLVGDGSLSQAVFVLRKALGESEEGFRFIETVPRVGYRFQGDVSELPSEVARVPPRRRRLLRALVAAGIAAAAVALVVAGRGRLSKPPRALGLLSLVRESAVAPDATRLLGHLETTSIVAAPGAYDLVPDDGSASTRIPLRDGEIALSVWDDALALVRGDAIVLFDPLGHAERATIGLPHGPSGPAPTGWLAAPDGRYVLRRLPDEIEVLERRGDAYGRAALLPLRARDGERIALGTRYLAVVEGGGEPLRVYTLPDGALALEAPFAELRVSSVAVDDAGGRVAVGGPFGEIDVFRVGGPAAPLRLERHGWTHGLTWVPDAPTLVASGYYGVAAFRGGAIVEEAPGVASTGESLLTFPGGLLVFSTGRHRIAALAYAGAEPSKRVDAKSAVLWALEHDASGETVFAGGRDGRLYSLDVARSRLTSVAAHADGIPSLLRDGRLLASSSDDKTVAVWQLPGPTLVRRTAAHRYLVNDTAVAPRAPGGAALVTSSSDGTLKIWSWPGLEAKETLSAEALTGRASELHAVWASPDLSRLLVGTWDGALLDVDLSRGAPSARRIPVRSSVVYELGGLPDLGLVAGVGHAPADVFVFDLQSGTVLPLERAGLDAFSCAVDPARNQLFVVGNGGLTRYSFERQGERLRYTYVARRQGGLWLTAATHLPSGSLWAGTESGALVGFGADAFEGEASGSGEAPPRDDSATELHR